MLALTAGLTACATMPGSPGASSGGAKMGAHDEISAAALDPLDAPPPPMAMAADSAAAPTATADPLLLVPAQTQASQRVPLGTLNASSDPKPAAKPPTPLSPRGTTAKVTPPPAPVATAATAAAPVQEFVPAATPPAAAAPSPPPVAAAAPQKAPVLNAPPRATPAAKEEPRAPVVVAQAPPTAAAPPAAAATTKPLMFEEETTIISSATVPPAVQVREFVPAPVIPVAAPPAPPALGEMPFTQAERNTAKRFETLARLRDDGLITQDEFNRRRAANLGAILPYSQDPPGVGLDRSVPPSEAIVARLGALRRSFEMRAITAQQHALERTMILNALLPESPEQRTARKPPPEDVIQGAAMVGHLEFMRENGVITQSELDTERRMIDAVLRTGLLPPKGSDAAAAAKTAEAKTAAKPAAPSAAAASDSPMDRQITGPVLHLASFRSEASAMKAWQQVVENNKAILGPLKPIIRRVDLGEGRGIFYRLMTGSFTSMAEAEGVCVKLKQNNQFCRASTDGT